MGGRGDRRPAPDGERRARLLPLQRQERVLERSGGEGLRQVSGETFSRLFIFLKSNNEELISLFFN